MGIGRAELILAGFVALGGCNGKKGDEKKAAQPGAESGKSDRPVAPGGRVDIKWMSDDWPGALAAARRDKKPIFVDLWAPWCHTCLAMKQVVMVDPSLAPYVDRFVWLEIDTDRPQNAEVLESLTIDIWPTFYVVSAGADGVTVQARHIEAASIGQLRELLDQGEQAHLAWMAKEGSLDRASPLGMVQLGDAAAAKRDFTTAGSWYARALAAAPDDWPRAPTTLTKQMRAQLKTGDLDGCADLGMSRVGRAAQGMTAALTLFAQMANECAQTLDVPRARVLRGRLAEALLKVVDAPDSAMSVDDQSDALRVLREMALALGDSTTARAYAVRQRDMLDRAFAQAGTAMERMTHNWPRTEVYFYLGEGARIIPDLERLVADLPKEYDPVARLAWARHKLGQNDAALPLAEKALAMAYGPRKGAIHNLIAEIHKAKGNLDAERKARQAALDHYQAQTGGHSDEDKIAQARDALDAVGKAPPKK